MSGAPRAEEIFGDTRKPRRVFDVLSETRYRLSVPDLGLSFEIDRLRRERGELCGDLIVRTDMAGARTFNGILSSGNFNLDSVQARGTRAKALREKARLQKDDPLDFAEYLDELCIRVSAADRAGQPAIDLSAEPMPTDEPTVTVAGFTLYPNHPQILFGDGGTLKSTTAIYVGGELILQKGYRVLFVDWELDARDHRRRWGQLFGATPPRILYARCEKPLVYEADRLKRIVQEEGINFLILDSIAFASDGPPEAAEVAGRYFRALRQIGVGSLNVAHITKGDGGDQKPFGSAFWHNGCRASWFVKAGDQTPNGLSIGLFNRKANLGPLLPPIGYEVDFSDERITFLRVPVEDVESLAVGLPLWLRVKTAVRHKPQTIAALAEELEAKQDTIDRTVRRLRNVFTRVSGDDGVSRIALVTRDAA